MWGCIATPTAAWKKVGAGKCGSLDRWMDEAYLARGPVQVGVPLWPELYMAAECLCLHTSVWWREEGEVSAAEETRRWHSAVWKIGGRVLSVCISLPLSEWEYNPFHSLWGRAENEPALSLPPLPSCSVSRLCTWAPSRITLSMPPPCRR